MSENVEKQYKKKYHGVPVYACQSDTLNPKLLSLIQQGDMSRTIYRTYDTNLSMRKY